MFPSLWRPARAWGLGRQCSAARPKMTGWAVVVAGWKAGCNFAVQLYRVFSTDTECTGCSVSVYSAPPHRSRSQAAAGSRETAAGVSRAAGDHCTQAPGRQQPQQQIFLLYIQDIFTRTKKLFNEIFFPPIKYFYFLLLFATRCPS